MKKPPHNGFSVMGRFFVGMMETFFSKGDREGIGKKTGKGRRVFQWRAESDRGIGPGEMTAPHHDAVGENGGIKPQGHPAALLLGDGFPLHPRGGEEAGGKGIVGGEICQHGQLSLGTESADEGQRPFGRNRFFHVHADPAVTHQERARDMGGRVGEIEVEAHGGAVGGLTVGAAVIITAKKEGSGVQARR
jgi:hypothetical protein